MKKDQRKVVDVVPTVQPGEVAEPKERKGRLKAFEFSISFDAIAGNLFRTAKGQSARSRFVDLLRQCTDPEIRKIVTLWDATPKSKKPRTKIEDLCERANLDCRWVIEKTAGLMYTLGTDVTKLFVAIHQPDVLQKTVQQALTKDGHKDRELFLKGSGFLPAPANQFGVMVNNNLPSGPSAQPQQAGMSSIPPLEDDNTVDTQFEAEE